MWFGLSAELIGDFDIFLPGVCSYRRARDSLRPTNHENAITQIPASTRPRGSGIHPAIRVTASMQLCSTSATAALPAIPLFAGAAQAALTAQIRHENIAIINLLPISGYFLLINL